MSMITPPPHMGRRRMRCPWLPIERQRLFLGWTAPPPESAGVTRLHNGKALGLQSALLHQAELQDLKT
jgi:hypothetical protein